MDISRVENALDEHRKIFDEIKTSLPQQILPIVEICTKALQNGNKLLFCGNGGSAADSQHLAAEFVGRFQIERGGLPAIALTTDTSVLTAVSNDYGYTKVFSRQVEALGQKGDVLFALSTSGESPNVLMAVEKAKEKGIVTIGLTGRTGGSIADACDMHINVPQQKSARIQEMHIMIGHIICELLDDVKHD